jgi:uncharacterized protein (TIRG00374 family)
MSWQKKAHAAGIVVTVFLLALILWRVNLTELVHSFRGIVWVWVIGVLLLNVANTWIEAFRWRLILSSVKKETHTLNTFAAMLVGVVGNTVLPLRLGDGARAYYLAKREKIAVASALGTVMLDRVVDVTFFLIIVVLTGLFYHFPRLVERAGLMAGIAVAVALIVCIALMIFRRRLEFRFGGKPGSKLIGQIHRFTMGLSSLKEAGVLLPAGVLSAFSWGLRAIMVACMFKAFSFGLPRVAALVVLIFTNLGIAAVSTPANLGGFELSTLAAFKLFGADTERALSCAIVFHAVEVAPMVLFGLLALWISGLGPREILKQKKLSA